MTRRAILNVAAGHWYPRGQQRLFDSLQERGENTTRLFWRDTLPAGSPTHQQAPYAFKPYAFQAARRHGFDHAVWLDASCWALKPLDQIWLAIDEDGHYLEPDGHVTGNWITDLALELLQIDRDEAMRIPLVDGKAIGLDFHDPTSLEFLDEWTRLADAGAFAGAWDNEDGSCSADPRCNGHRHDIAVGSPLADSLGMRIQPRKLIWFPADGDAPDHFPLVAQGM